MRTSFDIRGLVCKQISRPIQLMRVAYGDLFFHRWFIEREELYNEARTFLCFDGWFDVISKDS